MPILYENYITGDDTNIAFYETIAWEAQTFTPSIAHTITSVKVKLLRFPGSTPGAITAYIRDTDGDGKPTGGNLASGVYADGNSITDSSPGEWIEITLAGGTSLSASIKYAIILKSSTDDTNNPIWWRRDASAPSYAGGSAARTDDEGTTWILYAAEDLMFEDWGDATGTPIVTTQAVTGIVTTTATGNGNVTDLGASSVTEHGHCWNTGGLPTTSDSKTTNGSKATTGTFTSSLTSLTSGTLYYVRAYATNTDGTAYGDEVSFTAGSPRGGELSGLYAVVEERFHYVDAYGVERALLGEPV